MRAISPSRASHQANASLTARETSKRLQPEVSKHSILPAMRTHEPTALTNNATVDDAIAIIVITARTHWSVHEAAARDQQDIEGLHQVRVGLRRFRSALTLFKSYLPQPQRAWFNDEARWLLNELGPARDLDVFMTDLLPPLLNSKNTKRGMKSLLETLHILCGSAHARARAALVSQRYQRFARHLEAWVTGHGWRSEPGSNHKDPRTITAKDFAVRVLNKRLIKISASGKRIDQLPVEELHRLRIAIKKTRYGIDFFGRLLPKALTLKLARALKSLQDCLGHLNDLAVAEEIISQLSTVTPNAITLQQLATAGALVLSHHRLAADEALRGIAPRWRALRKCGLF